MHTKYLDLSYDRKQLDIDEITYQDRIELYRKRVARQEPVADFISSLNTGMTDEDLVDELLSVRYKIKQIYGEIQLNNDPDFDLLIKAYRAARKLEIASIGIVADAFRKQSLDYASRIKEKCKRLDVSSLPYLT